MIVLPDCWREEVKMNERDIWKDAEKGKEEDYFMKKHREWLEKKKQKKDEPEGKPKKGNKAIACPRCEKPLSEKNILGMDLFHCGICGGGWLDQESLRGLLEAADQAE
jgi:Zn-finger nucleic acid-binding protein